MGNRIFLIEYDRATSSLKRIDEYSCDERDRAVDARLELEISLLASGIEHEIVLLEADSRESLSRTHSRYFRDVQDMVEAGNKSVRSTPQSVSINRRQKSPKES